jgi:hypothetical protein
MPKVNPTSHPLAFCSIHGVFPATAVGFAPGATLTMINCSTNCPVCGTSSEILPGQYRSESDRLNVLLDPSISSAALAAIRKLALAVKEGRIDASEAKKEAEKIHPAAGKLFDVANWSDQAKATLFAAIIGATAVIGAARITSTANQPTKPPYIVVEQVIELKKNDFLSTSSLGSSTRKPQLSKSRPKRHR